MLEPTESCGQKKAERNSVPLQNKSLFAAFYMPLFPLDGVKCSTNEYPGKLTGTL